MYCLIESDVETMFIFDLTLNGRSNQLIRHMIIIEEFPPLQYTIISCLVFITLYGQEVEDLQENVNKERDR